VTSTLATEDDFQSALDRDPDDYTTRLVFADWLDEHGDPRAEGYRRLGTIRFRGWYQPTSSWWECGIPPTASAVAEADILYPYCGSTTGNTRRAAEDAAALAFARLAGAA
jgi:uncharacterized protein (TIGR02996 family)